MLSRDERIKTLNGMPKAQLIAERRAVLAKAGFVGQNAADWSKDELIANIIDAEDRLEARGKTGAF